MKLPFFGMNIVMDGLLKPYLKAPFGAFLRLRNCSRLNKLLKPDAKTFEYLFEMIRTKKNKDCLLLEYNRLKNSKYHNI
jgi:hypothetical protein